MNSVNGLDLFISISLTYPELNAVRYDTDYNVIVLEIALHGGITCEEEKTFCDSAEQCLKIYHAQKRIDVSLAKIYLQRLHELSLLHFQRDVDTMSEGEIELILGLTRDSFPGRIIFDTGDSITEEPFKYKVKQNLMRRISKEENKHHFLAFRKQGRVLVFQK